MPVIKSAIKKLRKDRKREKENDARRRSLEWAIRQARKSPSTPIKSGSKINAAYQALDQAVKRNIIHKNKAARIKASLAKLARPAGPRTKPKASLATKKKARTAKK